MILTGDSLTVLRTLDAGSVQTCVTSPPYWGLRDYGVAGQLGLEATYPEYIAHVVAVFREVRRVLRADGTLWLNLGDSYATGAGKAAQPGGGLQGDAFQGPRGYRGSHDSSPKHRGARPQVPYQKNPDAGIPTFQPNRMPQPGLKPKDLVMLPARVAIALQDDGWYLRSDIVWHKPNPMPESVTDRPTKAHEYLFLLAKSERYYYDADAIKEPTTGSAHDRARKERSAFGQKTLPTMERNGMRPASKVADPGSGIKYNSSFSAADELLAYMSDDDPDRSIVLDLQAAAQRCALEAAHLLAFGRELNS